MTATFSNTTANALMSQLAAAGLFASLHTNNPGTTGAAELAAAGYARQASTLGSGSGQQTANAGIITFGPAAEDWTEVTHVGLWSAVSGGSFVAGAALDASRIVATLGSASFAIADLIFSLDAIA